MLFSAFIKKEKIYFVEQAQMFLLNREIFRVLDLMKMDMVNFTIQSFRPELQRQSVEYERDKFQSILERTPGKN